MNQETHDFEHFMRERERAAKAYVRGDPGPLGRMVVHNSPATFFGPGGGIEQGALQVYGQYEADAAQFAEGESDFEILHLGAGDGLAYWTGIQRAQVRIRKHGQVDKQVSMNLRVTEVFRREGTEWKLMHRHADRLEEGAGAR